MDNKRLSRVFDQVRPSRDREEAMLERLLYENEREARPTMKRSRKLTAALALAAALVLTVCAFAVAAALEPEFLRYFGAGAEDEQLLCSAAVPLNQTMRGSGGTFYLRQAVADRYSVKILMDFTAPEGTVLDGDFYKPDASWDVYGADGEEVNPAWFSGWELVEDGDSGDNQITLLFTLNPGAGGEDLLGGTMRLRLKNLYRDNICEDLALEGKWSCSIQLPEEDPGAWYSIDRPTDIGGHSVKLSALYVSPISLVCDLEEGAESLRTIKDTVWEGWQEGVALVTARGERVGVDAGEYDMHISYYDLDHDRELAHFRYRPERIVDPADIAAVELFGQRIELDPAILESVGGTAADAPLLEDAAAVPEVSVESGGCTLEVRQAWADQYKLSVLWELTAPEGTVLDGDAYRLEGEHGQGWRVTGRDGARSTWRPGVSAWSGGWSLVEDDDPSDNRLTLLQTLHVKGGAPELVGGRYAFQFTHLLTGSIGEGDTVLEGDWSGSFPLPEGDVGVGYDIGQSLTLEGKAVTLDSVYISPVTLALELGEGSMDLRQTDYRKIPTNWREYIFLVTAEGERIAMDRQEGSLGPDLCGDPERGRYVCQPERIIDPAEIAAVELFGQTVALKG